MPTTAAIVAIFTAVFVAIFVAVFLPLIAFASKAEQDKARTRRMADAKMNARLLGLDI
jgi:preprotein translocase subunit SecG